VIAILIIGPQRQITRVQADTRFRCRSDQILERLGASLSLDRLASFHLTGSAFSYPGAYGPIDVACESTGVLRAVVPFGVTSGPITVLIGREVAVSSTFTATEFSDTLRLVVKRYDLAPGITASDSSIIDWQGHHCAWSAIQLGDTVHISRRYGTGEVIFEHHFKFLSTGQSQLPRLLNAWRVMIPDYPDPWVDTIRAGILKVQDWNTTGVMSGRFFGKPWFPGDDGIVTFWVDRSR
jgi:hypothetical protein